MAVMTYVDEKHDLIPVTEYVCSGAKNIDTNWILFGDDMPEPDNSWNEFMEKHAKEHNLVTGYDVSRKIFRFYRINKLVELEEGSLINDLDKLRIRIAEWLS